MQTRDQQRAAKAFEHVSALDPKSTLADDYGRYAHKLPVLIRQAGLAQALTFVEAKGRDGGKRLLGDLAKYLHGQGMLPQGETTALTQRIRSAELTEYQFLTREVVATLGWYKRFSVSVLNIEVAKDLADAPGH